MLRTLKSITHSIRPWLHQAWVESLNSKKVFWLLLLFMPCLKMFLPISWKWKSINLINKKLKTLLVHTSLRGLFCKDYTRKPCLWSTQNSHWEFWEIFAIMKSINKFTNKNSKRKLNSNQPNSCSISRNQNLKNNTQ